MLTAKGEIPIERLRKHVLSEPVPCGKCITTQYFDSSGELVKQDIDVIVDHLPEGLGSSTGE